MWNECKRSSEEISFGCRKLRIFRQAQLCDGCESDALRFQQFDLAFQGRIVDLTFCKSGSRKKLNLTWVDENRGFGSIGGRGRKDVKGTKQYYGQGDRDH